MEKNTPSHSPEKKILRILRSPGEGRTITELTEISQLSRSAVRTALAKLEGAKKIIFRPIGMAKVYFRNTK
ncbi:winged helix-turn-helix transcriptional regulator [Candidatus Pacearchaeota archaeon]|nr:winged helix-turn-helix transcriptional regulator [Candidatus Pacearchaeota archaeon]